MYTLQRFEHVYSFGSWALPPSRAVAGGVLWFVVCFLVGVFEEGAFRGYAQFTVGKAIGFWAAAFTISFAFGFIHLLDPNYTALGIGGPTIFGLLFAFCLRRNGDLWLAMGIHSAVDFSELSSLRRHIASRVQCTFSPPICTVPLG
jgi:membrane protease YdiL (CAAX protease family)